MGDIENNVTLSEKVEKRNPAFAGLPIDESADAWMNDDVVPMIESDDDNDEKQTNTQDLKLEAEYKKSDFAGLPIDDSSDTRIPIVVKETSGTTSENVSKKQLFAGLPIDEAIDSWMDDDVGTMQESDEEESENQVENIAKISEQENNSSSSDKNITLINIDDSKDIPVVEKGTPAKTVENISKKPSFVGLPIDEAIDSWMDDDVGIIQESDEDESEGQSKNIAKVCEQEIKVSESKPKENTNSKPQTTKKNKIEKKSTKEYKTEKKNTITKSIVSHNSLN